MTPTPPPVRAADGSRTDAAASAELAAARIEAALRAHADRLAAALRIARTDTTVTLHGDIDCEGERAVILRAARSVPGVTDVVDRMRR